MTFVIKGTSGVIYIVTREGGRSGGKVVRGKVISYLRRDDYELRHSGSKSCKYLKEVYACFYYRLIISSLYNYTFLAQFSTSMSNIPSYPKKD